MTPLRRFWPLLAAALLGLAAFKGLRTLGRHGAPGQGRPRRRNPRS